MRRFGTCTFPQDNVASRCVNELQARRLLARSAAFLAEFVGCFGRPTLEESSRRYIRGPLSDKPRKSMQPMVEALTSDAKYQSLQHFIAQASWDCGKAWARLRQMLPAGPGLLLIDNTGFSKQGSHSVGVARQYSGTLGKVGSCQIAVASLFAQRSAVGRAARHGPARGLARESSRASRRRSRTRWCAPPRGERSDPRRAHGDAPVARRSRIRSCRRREFHWCGDRHRTRHAVQPASSVRRSADDRPLRLLGEHRVLQTQDLSQRPGLKGAAARSEGRLGIGDLGDVA
ncbi:MAG: hypothetical protein DMF49_12340 [Acidobacteria bacterium]|nr:MAG: hypothetical protein DMF49_12340 [Acidobacteriota bacterium]